MSVSTPRKLSRRLQRGDLLAEACPSRDVLKHVTSRWGVLVLMVLEGDGLVLRIAHEVVPPHVEYSLTPLGRDAAKRVRGLADWIELNLPKVQAFQADRSARARQREAQRGASRVHRLV